MLHVKSCNVKHNSESVFRYFASVVNTNESLKCNRQDHSTICSYRSLHKVRVMFLCTPFENHCLAYRRLGLAPCIAHQPD